MKFQITYKSTGQVDKFRANQWIDFESAVWDILRYVSAFNTSELDYEFIVDGSIVNLDLAVKAAKFARNEWEAKRSTTKKQIWVRTGGVTNAKSNFRQIWVNK